MGVDHPHEATMLFDEKPIHYITDDFRRECAGGRIGFPYYNGVLQRCAPNIDFDHCHVIDFGYIVDIGGAHPETLSAEEATVLKEPLFSGAVLAYPRMLFINRISRKIPTILISHVYRKNGFIAMEYYIRDGKMNHWVKIGHVENVSTNLNGMVQINVRQWGMLVTEKDLENVLQDEEVITHIRTTLVLIAILMRRGDEVEQIVVPRPVVEKLKTYQKKNVASVSVIKLNKINLVKNIDDEAKAVEEEESTRTVKPHDRAGSTTRRTRDHSCEHVWVQEYRDNERWRNRCFKCDSCEFWRRTAKVHGGAEAIAHHVVV